MIAVGSGSSGPGRAEPLSGAGLDGLSGRRPALSTGAGGGVSNADRSDRGGLRRGARGPTITPDGGAVVASGCSGPSGPAGVTGGGLGGVPTTPSLDRGEIAGPRTDDGGWTTSSAGTTGISDGFGRRGTTTRDHVTQATRALITMASVPAPKKRQCPRGGLGRARRHARASEGSGGRLSSADRAFAKAPISWDGAPGGRTKACITSCLTDPGRVSTSRDPGRAAQRVSISRSTTPTA
jgi:hypothetical protein